ncbi:winged helix-turn-helix domain-containing protein [Falsarthrobacter nasiphocae]|uniref:DNA-binding winged helix-turn-helix (WHTH) protein n=1 Tax=Falsarthrobacter nasiphocae TaxID=189863 RepID=A0AAE4C6U8_9MICC|nr:winged helix-turn-helix domain-containing protein [Falsarthrobacter nasiphocae]MDR6891804.1 DNA-binding winged helix-turn-helix (wHTH) protein [Falsarthrobacter nasiphocae]
MPTTSGYVHVSRRVSHVSQEANSSVYGAQVGVGRPAGPYGAAHVGNGVVLTAPAAVVATPPAEPGSGLPDAVARGFVIYVGLSEQTAHEAGLSLTRVAQQARAYIHELVPQAESHAAVALAPTDAAGDDLEIVRRALGDPGMPPRPAPRRKPSQEEKEKSSKVVSVAGVLIDLARREVYLDGVPLSLTFKEFELIFLLVENQHRVVSREEMLTEIWGAVGEQPSLRTIDVHIRRLRTKLGRLSGAVRTVRGEGYRFFEHPEVVVWTAPEYYI